MKFSAKAPLSLILFPCVFLAGCGRTSNETAPPAPAAEEKHGPVSPLKPDAEARVRMGLTVGPVSAVEVGEEIPAYGVVVDPTPLAALAAEMTTAEVAAKTSGNDSERLKKLAAAQNASGRAVLAAETTAEKDRLAGDAVRVRLLIGWGSALAKHDDLPGFVVSLATREKTLVRLELPSGESVVSPPLAAKITGMGATADAVFLDEAPSVAAGTQGRAWFFLIASRSPGLVPGAIVSGRITTGAPKVAGLAVPEAALLRVDGKTFVYVDGAAEGFRRVEVTPGKSVAAGRVVSGELKAGDKVAVVGAAQLLSAELLAGDPEGGE